jgi:hypothetical protein
MRPGHSDSGPVWWEREVVSLLVGVAGVSQMHITRDADLLVG